MADVFGEGRVLESLSFEARGEASTDNQVTVLSCGGIYIPQKEISLDYKNWLHVVNLPGPQFSAKIFGDSTNFADPLNIILKQEQFN